jgi:hypothetical protein
VFQFLNTHIGFTFGVKLVVVIIHQVTKHARKHTITVTLILQTQDFVTTLELE